LLSRLRPEGAKVRRDHHACYDLAVCIAERRNLVGEIIRQRLVTARINQIIARIRKRWWQAKLWIAPCVAVRIIREQATNVFRNAALAPDIQKDADDILKAPEKVVGALEALRRIR